MSEARSDMTQARPQEAAAAQAEAVGQGRHRGQQATSEEAQAQAHGRHRRPSGNAS